MPPREPVGTPERIVYIHGPRRIRRPPPGDGLTEPKNWTNCVIAVTRALTGHDPVAEEPADLVRRGTWYLSMSPTLRLLPAVAAGRPLIFLSWGMPPRSGPGWLRRVKLARLAFILRRAFCVLVNDPTAAGDVFRLSGRRAHTVPYVVDTDFFVYKPRRDAAGAGAFVLVPGDSDRDEETVSALARAGVEVVRVTRSEQVRDLHLGRALPGVTVRFRIPYAELRDLYQEAAAVVLPISADNHVAGQTALLEAAACGAPILTNGPRLLDALRQWEHVFHLPFETTAQLGDLIREVAATRERIAPRLEAAARAVAARHHPERVAEAVVEIVRGRIAAGRPLAVGRRAGQPGSASTSSE